MSFSDLPAINACLNGVSATLLVLGFVFIKRRNDRAHRNCMIAAFIASTLFLAGYLTYHFTKEFVTRFADPAWFRPIYLFILISHSILAPVLVPMVFMSISRGLKGQNERHKKISRWTWPIWMYVSITGVVIYLLLYQIFPQKTPLRSVAPSQVQSAASAAGQGK